MSDSTGQSNSYVVEERRQAVINGRWHDVWPIVHTPSTYGVCVVILPFEDSTKETIAERIKTAAKIAACLNACDGINPEAVPELVMACEELLPHAEEWIRCTKVMCEDPSRYPDDRVLAAVSDAIAKAKAHD